MEIQVEKKEKYAILTLKGEKLNSLTSPDLKGHFVVLHAEGVRNVVVDLSQVEYADSSGLSALLNGNRLCKDLNGSFVLAGVRDSVNKIIHISQLDRVLTLTPTVKEAEDLVFMDEVERDLLNE